MMGQETGVQGSGREHVRRRRRTKTSEGKVCSGEDVTEVVPLAPEREVLGPGKRVKIDEGRDQREIKAIDYRVGEKPKLSRDDGGRYWQSARVR